MSGRRALEERRARLGEVGEILRAMKNLAYLQVRRLARLVEGQREALTAIDEAAADLLAWHPYSLPRPDDGLRAVVVVGTERGFVGDLNQRLLRRLEGSLGRDGGEVVVIAVGRRLLARLAGHPRLVGAVEGASVAEEVPGVVRRVVAELDRLPAGARALTLTVLASDASGEAVSEQCLLPPFEAHIGRPCAEAFPPFLYLTPERLLSELAEHYLLAALHAIVSEALLGESHRRVRHLEGAVRHVDDRLEAIDRQVRVLRQEEVIEEIEVILLGASGSGSGPGPQHVAPPRGDAARGE